MKKFKAFLFILGMFGLFSLTSQIKANEAPVINVELTVLVGESPGEAPIMNLDYPLGGTFSITPQTYENHVFSHWVVNGVLRTDLAEDHQFTVKSEMKLQAVYKPTDENLHPILFIDTNGKVLQFKVLATGAQIIAPVDQPSKLASTFVGYADITDYETALSEFPTAVGPATYVAKYELQDQTSEYEVKLDGVSLGLFKANTVVSLLSEDASFKYFVDEDTNEILSYNNAYKFSMLKSPRNIKTVLEGDITYPLVSLHKEAGIREGFDSYLGHYELGEGQTLVEAGVEFNVGEELHKLPAKSYNATTNEFLFSLKQSSNPENVKTYIIYKDAEGLHTIYNKALPSLIQLPAPIHGMGVITWEAKHVAVGPYEEAGGENGGFVGFGFLFTNTTTNEAFTWSVNHPYKAGFGVHFDETLGLTPGDYVVKYYARGNGTTTSDSVFSIHQQTFNVPKPVLGTLTLSIDYNLKTLSWNNVANATSYEVYVDDVLQLENTSPFSLEEITAIGSHMLKVVAKAEGYQDSVKEIEYIIAGETTQLQTPENLNAEGTMLTWDAVENATNYAIAINDITKHSTTNSFNLEAFDLGNQTVTITVVAQGDPVYYTDSEPVEITHKLPELNPRLNAMTAGDMVHSYLQNSVDGGHYKAEFYTGHDVFKQSGFSVNKGIRFVLKKDDVVLDTLNWTLSSMIMLHTPNSTTSFYGRNNLVYGETYQIEIILLADSGSNYRDSLPFVTTFVYKAP